MTHGLKPSVSNTTQARLPFWTPAPTPGCPESHSIPVAHSRPLLTLQLPQPAYIPCLGAPSSRQSTCSRHHIPTFDSNQPWCFCNPEPPPPVKVLAHAISKTPLPCKVTYRFWEWGLTSSGSPPPRGQLSVWGADLTLALGLGSGGSSLQAGADLSGAERHRHSFPGQVLAAAGGGAEETGAEAARAAVCWGRGTGLGWDIWNQSRSVRAPCKARSAALCVHRCRDPAPGDHEAVDGGFSCNPWIRALGPCSQGVTAVLSSLGLLGHPGLPV